MKFYCPYCRSWITDTVHRQHFHNDPDHPDDMRDNRVMVGGLTYEDELDYDKQHEKE